MKYDAVIFDLGNTLAAYFTREQWPDILDEAIGEVAAYLAARGLMGVGRDGLSERVQVERGEKDAHRVRPLADRLKRIFKLSRDELSDAVEMEMCRCFMKPIFAVGRRYDDALPALAELKRRGLRTGILSNTPWGSPAQLWREELARLGLLDAVDEAVFCVDVGWRKPARQPFEFIMQKLCVGPGECLFVGDDPRWDIAGPRGVGMDAVLIDRHCPGRAGGVNCIHGMAELLDRL